MKPLSKLLSLFLSLAVLISTAAVSASALVWVSPLGVSISTSDYIAETITEAAILADYVALNSAGSALGAPANAVARAIQEPEPTPRKAESVTNNQPGTAIELGEYVNIDSMYDQINAFRTKRGVWVWNPGNLGKTYYNLTPLNTLIPLKRDRTLEAVARLRAKEIATRYSHTRPDGTSCATAYPGLPCGENLARGYASISTVMIGWEEEDKDYAGQGHRRNLLSKEFNAVGVACYKRGNTYYWCQSFGVV